MKSKFVYVIYIYTTPEKLWQALLTPEFTRQYWFGVSMQSDGGWKKGTKWKMTGESGTLTDEGEVIESDPPHKLVLSWTNRWKPEMEAEGPSRATFTIEAQPHGAVKLTVVHEMDRDASKLIEGVSTGWPQILSNLKTLLEKQAA